MRSPTSRESLKHPATPWGRRLSSWALVLAAVCLALPPPADARRRRLPRARISKERHQARALVKQGVQKLRVGDYVEALALFTRAYGIFPSPKIQFNIGQTYKELGRYLDAITAYERFLEAAPKEMSAVVIKLARDNVRDLMRKIAVLTVRISVKGASITVDGQALGHAPLPKPIRLMPGPHSVVVKKDGYVPAVLSPQLAPNERRLLQVTLKRPPRPTVVRVIYRTVHKRRRGLALLWTGVALTGASSLVAAVLGGLALREQKHVDDLSLSLAVRRDAADRGKIFQRTTDGMLIGAGVIAAGALVWYLVVVRPSGGTRRVKVTETAWRPLWSPRGAGLSIAF